MILIGGPESEWPRRVSHPPAAWPWWDETGRHLVRSQAGLDGRTISRKGTKKVQDKQKTNAPKPYLGALAVFAFLVSVYTFTFGSLYVSGDEVALLAGAESFGRRGEFTVDQAVYTGIGARDGIHYRTVYEAFSVIIPGLWYRLACSLPWWNCLHATVFLNVFAVAATGALVYLLSRQVGLRHGAAIFGALTFGVATPIWAYTDLFYREPLGGLTLLLFVYAAYSLSRIGGLRPHQILPLVGLLFAGAVLAAGTKDTNIVALLVVGAGTLTHALFAGLRRTGRGKALLYPLAGAVVAGAIVAAIAVVRTVYETPPAPYLDIDKSGVFERWRSVLRVSPEYVRNTYGFLFSPGKGVFVHSPVLLAGLVVAGVASRQRYVAAVLPAAALLGLAWTYAHGQDAWWGGRGWGPRYLVPALPLLALGAAAAWDWARQRHRQPLGRGTRRLLGFLFLLSVLFQVPGALVNVGAYHDYLARTVGASAPFTSALWQPGLAEVIRGWAVVRPGNLDPLWMRTLRYSAALGAVGGAAALAGMAVGARALWRSAHRDGAATARALGISIVLVPLIFLGAAEGAPPARQSDGFRQAKEVLAAYARQDDTLIIDLPAHAQGFLATGNTVGLRWYGADSCAGRPALASREELETLALESRGLWFILPTEGCDTIREFRTWINEGLYRGPAWNLGGEGELRFGALARNAAEPQAVRLQFGKAAVLERYALQVKPGRAQDISSGSSQSCLQPADTILTRLVWIPLRRTREPLSFSLKLVDGNGRTIGQRDDYPGGGFWPTTAWPPGEAIVDQVALPVLQDHRGCDARLVLSLYDPSTLQAQMVWDAEGLERGTQVLLHAWGAMGGQPRGRDEPQPDAVRPPLILGD